MSADQLEAALDELLDTRNAMTRVLLGGHRARTREPDGRGAGHLDRRGPRARACG